MGATFATVKLSATGTGEFITNWAGFPLPDYGNYSFNIHIADNLSKVVPFAVARRRWSRLLWRDVLSRTAVTSRHRIRMLFARSHG